MENNLLLFAFEYPPVSGGISRLCAGIAGTLAERGTRTCVLTQEAEAVRQDATVPAVRVSPRRPLREWSAFRWLKRHSAASLTVCGIWYPEGLLAYLAGKRPLVILAHGAELLPGGRSWRRHFWSRLQRRVLEAADLVIANSDYTRKLVVQSAPKAKVEAIPLAVDTQRFAPGDREAAKAKLNISGKHVLCTVSRICRYKAIDVVLRAIAMLPPSARQDLVYLVVGTGPEEQRLKALAAELGVEANVRWLGFVPENELPQVYWASDLFVLCTREAANERLVEGFGLVFLEAQACGVPVVGTRTGGIPAAIEEGEGGWLIEQDDSEQLANIIRDLAHSPDRFRAAGVRARERVVRDCTWDRYMQRFVRALEASGFVAQEKTPGVTVVVPTLNRGTYLIDTLRDLLAQEYRPLEILVVDQSQHTTPALAELVRNYPEVINYCRVDFRGLPQARNYGWQRARYEAIVFVDDDIRCAPSLVSEHVRALTRPNVGMVAGGIDERASAGESLTQPGEFNAWTATPARGFHATGEKLVSHVPGGNFSAWRSVLQTAGGVDETLATGAALYEETDLCLRVRELGFDIYFNGSARLTHLAAANGGCRITDVSNYVRWLGHNRVILIRRHLRWFHAPTAYARLLLLFCSYALHYHNPGAIRGGIVGLMQGLRAAKQAPVCGQYRTAVKA